MYESWKLERQSHRNISHIETIYTDDGKKLWLGLNPYGIALHNRTTGKTL